MAVFPGLQGEPHSHAVGGIAVANAQRLAACLIKLGFKVVTGGTDIHLVLVDTRKSESVSISGNKNTGPRDKPSLITRDLDNHDVVELMFLNRSTLYVTAINTRPYLSLGPEKRGRTVSAHPVVEPES